MLNQTEVKYIQSLHDKKNRQQFGLFIAEGPKLMEELLTSNYVIKKIYATANWLKNFSLDCIETKEVAAYELDKISQLQNANQVIAIVEQKENIIPHCSNQLNIVLDGIQDPGNLGTIIRLADWYGIKNILCSADCVALYNHKVIQSTMGSFVRVNCWYGNIVEVLLQANMQVYGALLHGEAVTNCNKFNNGFLVIGSEGKGISSEVMSCITKAITIPKIGEAESLNAAVATGIILSHIV